MEQTKLEKLIAEKNERTERETLREAEGMIEQIVREQAKIKAANVAIADLRKQLAELGFENLNPKEVLG